MKFVVHSTDLSYAVNATCKAADKEGGVTIIAKGEKVTLVTSNGVLTIEDSIKADVIEEGKVTVPAKIFVNTVSKIPSAEVSISTDEKGAQASFIYDSGELKIATLTDKDYSSYIKSDKVTSGYALDSNDFKKIVEVICKFASQDNSRPVLMGVNIKSVGDLIIATSCDGYKLANRVLNVAQLIKDQQDIDIIVPTQTFQTVYSLIDKKAEKIQVFLANNNNLFVFEQDGLKITSSLIGGNYLKTESIIPKEFSGTVKVNKTSLIQSVDRSMVTGSNMVVLDISESAIAVSANSDSGMLNENVKAEVSGKTTDIAFNSKWFVDTLKSCDEDDVTLSLTGKLSPMVIKEKDQLFLLLPMRKA